MKIMSKAMAAVVAGFLAVATAQGLESAKETEQDRESRMAWWREARFGLFIHWGPVSLKGTEIGWSRGGERRGTGGKGEISLEIYDNLYKEFNPTKFNAKEWVAIAKAAGMKYLVFTSKHHDGFCEFDSKLTDYKITNSPFKRDVVKELADACHEAGMPLGFYYSPPDWHHPDYRTERHAKYVEYLHGQLRELCTNYGRIDIIWFDGLGGSAKDWDSEKLVAMIRGLQPKVIINDRSGLREDHDTPEQAVGGFQIDRPWESCITICNQWAWKPDDGMKSLKQCLGTLVRCAGGDGNLLFNVGPMPTGEIEPRQVARLKEMGQWVGKYGASIYGTRGGPWRPGKWGVSTRKGDVIYVHVFEWPRDGLVLPALGTRRVISAELLTGGKVTVATGAEGLRIEVAAADRQEIDTIVALKLDGAAMDESPISGPASLTTGKKATASNVHQNSAEYRAGRAVDNNPETRWATDGGTKTAWLEVDLGKEEQIGRAAISEAYEGRVQRFELQYKQGEEWKTLHKGTTIGGSWEQKFEPVAARVVRLNILESTEGPTIWEFGLYAPGKAQ